MTVKSRHHHKSHRGVSSDVEKIKAALLGATHHFKGRAEDVFTDSMNNVKDQTVIVRDNVTDYVAKKPLKSLGITLAAGVVIGLLIGRK